MRPKKTPESIDRGLRQSKVAGTGFEVPPENTENLNGQSKSGAESGAFGAENSILMGSDGDANQPKSAPNIPKIVDADLQAVVDAWQRLPDAVRAGILAMVRSIS